MELKRIPLNLDRNNFLALEEKYSRHTGQKLLVAVIASIILLGLLAMILATHTLF